MGLTRKLCTIMLASIMIFLGFSTSFATGQQEVKHIISYSQGVEQETTKGKVRGLVENEGKTLLWLGVPYAKPPVGNLRWKAPQEMDSWTGVRDATKAASVATQVSGSNVIGSEDSLYLNIYRPNTGEKNLPVLFHIHGGNNQTGSSSEGDGQVLAAKQNIVVVSIDYRLGPLGFLNIPAIKTGNPLEDSGNFGLLDINAALEWVNENIKSFGGNPKNITVSGHSAGGRDTMAVLASPLFKGKFQKAMPSSGGMTMSDPEGASKIATKALAPLVIGDGIKHTESEAVKWLNSATPEVTSYLYDLAAERLAKVMTNAGIRMGVFPHLFADGTVLPEEGFEVFKNGKFNDVPTLMIADESEFNVFALGDPYFTDSLKDGTIFTDQEKSAAWDFATKYGNILYGASNAQLNAQAMLESAKSPIYTTAFAWGSDPSVVGEQMAKLYGAHHGIHMDLLYGIPKNGLRSLFPDAYATGGVKDLFDKMQQYVGNFLRTGNPNGKGLVKWKPWKHVDKGPTHLYMDANANQAVFKMIDRRIVLSEVFQEMEKDTTVSENVKEDIIRWVLNGRFFSKELDLYFHNEPPLLK